MSQNLDNEVQQVNAITSELGTISSEVGSLQTQLDAATAEIARLKSQGVDTSALDAALQSMQHSADTLQSSLNRAGGTTGGGTPPAPSSTGVIESGRGDQNPPLPPGGNGGDTGTGGTGGQ